MGNSMCARKLKILYGDKCDGCGRNASVYHVYPVSRATSEESAKSPKPGGGGGGGGFATAFGRIGVYQLVSGGWTNLYHHCHHHHHCDPR